MAMTRPNISTLQAEEERRRAQARAKQPGGITFADKQASAQQTMQKRQQFRDGMKGQAVERFEATRGRPVNLPGGEAERSRYLSAAGRPVGASGTNFAQRQPMAPQVPPAPQPVQAAQPSQSRVDSFNAAAAPTPPAAETREQMHARLMAREEQARLRGRLRDEQEGFRYLAPADRDAARGRMGDIRNAHRGISAANAPEQPAQTPEQVAANRARLAGILVGEMDKQIGESQGRLNRMSSGPGLRDASVEAGSRIAPGLAKHTYSDVGDQYRSRDTLAMIGNQRGQMNFDTGEAPSAKQLMLREERAREQEQLARMRATRERAADGSVFGPTPTAEQLAGEAQRRGDFRAASIDVGNQANARVLAGREETESVRKALADRARLGLDAENAQLRQVVEGRGPQDVEMKIRQTEAETRLAEAQGQRRIMDRDRAVQESRYDTAQAASTFRDGMERISGALFTNGLLYGGRGNVDGNPVFRDLSADVSNAAFVDSTVVSPLEEYARFDPVRAAQDAQIMLAQMPPARSDGTYGVAGLLYKRPDALLLTERLNSMRRRLEMIAAASSPPQAPSGT